MSGMRKGRLRELADLLDRLDQGDPVELPGGLRVDGFYVGDPWRQSRRGLVDAANGRTLADLPALVCARWAPGGEGGVALAAKLLGLSQGSLVPLVNPGSSYWCRGPDLPPARVASACRYVASLTDADVRRRSRDDADAWRRLVWDQGYGRGLVRLSKLKRADRDAHGIGLPLAFLKWIARQGRWKPAEERELYAPEWGHTLVGYYDLYALAAELKKDPERFEGLRAEYDESRQRRRRAVALRPGSGPVMSGRYYANAKWVPFQWGVLVDGWIHLPGGVHRKEGARTVSARPVLQGGKPIFAPIPPKSGDVEAPFTWSDQGHAQGPGEKDVSSMEHVYGLRMTEREAIAFWSALQDAAARDPDIWIPPGTGTELERLRSRHR